MPPSDLAEKYSSKPARLVLFMVAAIVLADLATMFLISALLPGTSNPVLIVIEALTLACTVLPILWWFVVKPLAKAALTEKARAKAMNIQSVHDWEHTFNTITDMITVHDRDFNVIRANRAAQERLGLSDFSAGQVKCFSLFHGSDCPPHDCPSCRSLVTEKQVAVESYEPHLGMYLEMRAIPRIGSDNQLIGLIHVARDITERKRMETDLQNQKLFAENLIQNSAVATFALDPDHKVVLWNKACEELTGVPASQMIGTDDQWRPFYDRKRPVLADIIIANDHEKLSSLYEKHARSSLVSNGLHAEGWYLNLNGKNRYLIFDAAPIRGSRGELLVVIETLQDIPERQRIEDRLAQSESKLRTLIEAEQDCVNLIAEDGTLLEMNPAGLSMIEAGSFDQVAGMPIYAFMDPLSVKAMQALTRKVFRGETGSLEFEFTGLKGTHRWVEIRAVPLRNPEGQVIALLGVTRDISEHKKLESQLRHAQKMEAVGTLTGGIAHDFNNILTGIIGYGELLRITGRENIQWQGYLDHLLASAQRAVNLTRNLLTFSTKQVTTPKPVDLNIVIQGMEKLLQRVIGEDIEIKTHLIEREVYSQADIGQLEQVLMNLAVNARDAMPGGGILSLSTRVVEVGAGFIGPRGSGRAGVYALLAVQDTGMGMDDNIRERIFEPFYTTKEVGKGTGLGLSIVYGIIKQHGGDIECISQPGQGTTFNIYLPLIQKPGEQTRQLEKHLLKGGTETVLLTEDDEIVRKLTSTMLEELGYKVIVAADGEEAVSLFRQHSHAIDLLILDVVMPKKNGKQAYDEIRDIRPGIKTLFTSGYTADVISSRGLLEQGMHYIAKPASIMDLAQKMREVLDWNAGPHFPEQVP